MCDSNRELIDAVCFKPCPPGHRRTEDPRFCELVIDCPPNTYLANNQCVKLSVAPTQGVCPADYTMWLTNKCFPDCVLPFLEGGQTCVKPLLDSDFTYANCGFGYILKNNACEIQWGPAACALLFLAIVFIFIAYKK